MTTAGNMPRDTGYLLITTSILAFFALPITEKQREMARKGSAKNGTVGSPVNQQPKKNNVMARTR